MLRNSMPNYLSGPSEVFTCLCIYFQNMFTLFFQQLIALILMKHSKRFRTTYNSA